jgi:hypothetical protein
LTVIVFGAGRPSPSGASFWLDNANNTRFILHRKLLMAACSSNPRCGAAASDSEVEPPKADAKGGEVRDPKQMNAQLSENLTSVGYFSFACQFNVIVTGGDGGGC